jgi:cysteine-rich repeat protein
MGKQGGVKLVLFFLSLGLFILAPNRLAADNQSVVINEVAWMGTTVSANNEWIELRNLASSDINLDGWTLKAVDGSPQISLSGQIAASGYYLLERTDDNTVPSESADLIYIGALGNNGENLILKDNDENTVDQIDAATAWPAGDNTTKQTMERTDAGGWQNSAANGGTPKAVNSNSGGNGNNQNSTAVCGNGIIEDDEVCDDGNKVGGDGCDSACDLEQTSDSAVSATPQINYRWGDLVINEFVSDPKSGDGEWIELFNSTYQAINLQNWTIEDGGGAKTKLSGTIGNSGQNKFLVVNKPAGNLNNDGDQIILRYKDGVIDKVTYGNWDDGNKNDNAPVAPDPASVARKTDGYNSGNNINDFVITTTPTKGASNVITADAAVKASDKVVNSTNCVFNQDVVITEISPNPVGDDSQNEFIELYNLSNNDVVLSGWSLADSGKKKYTFKSSQIIKANNFLVISRASSSLSLNNDEDSVSLYQPNCAQPSEVVEYGGAQEGWSYNQTIFVGSNAGKNDNLKKISQENNIWVWSDIITPSQFNQIGAADAALTVDFNAPAEIGVGQLIVFNNSDLPGQGSGSLKYLWDFGDGATSSLASPMHAYTKAGSHKIKLTIIEGRNKVSNTKTIKVLKIGAVDKNGVVVAGVSSGEVTATTKKTSNKKTNIKLVAAINLSDVQNLSKGEYIRATGTVAVLPNVFGSQYFYIIGSGGAQVYNYKKDFPNLKIGDEIMVSGEISTANGANRIKTSNKNDIKIISYQSNLLPEKINCEDLNDDSDGRFVSVSGEVTAKKGATVFLDDGTDEAQVYLKRNTGLVASGFTVGDKVEVHGIVTKSGTNLRILPRGQEDVVRNNAKLDQMPGEVATSDVWQLAQTDKTMEMMKYVLVIAIFVIVVLVIAIFKMRKKGKE